MNIHIGCPFCEEILHPLKNEVPFTGETTETEMWLTCLHCNQSFGVKLLYTTDIGRIGWPEQEDDFDKKMHDAGEQWNPEDGCWD